MSDWDAFWLFAHLGVGGLCLVCAELERPTPSSSLRSSFLFDSNSHQTHYQNYLKKPTNINAIHQSVYRTECTGDRDTRR